MNRSYRHAFPLPSLFPDATKIGSDRFRALCPVHAETHPSCIVNYHRKYGWKWHCFSCGGDGDALDVLTERDLIAVREALRLLDSERFATVGRSIPADGLPPNSTGAGRLANEPPCQVRREPGITIICDSCRSETATVESRDYGRGLREWTSSAELEVATLTGWELSAGLEYAVGPKCLERAA